MEFGSGSSASALLMSRFDRESEPPVETTIATLLARATAGDSAAFEKIVALFERRVLSLACRLLGNMSDAQDAAQEAFIRAFKYLHRFDARRPFEPWLVRMTVNVCRDLCSKRKKLDFDVVAAEFPVTTATGDPHAELAAQQQRELVRRALATLPEKERAAIVLRDIEGFSTAEVAQYLGSSEATVRVQISSARVKIRKAIERMKGGPR